jgi:NADH-quinone oxidoreductase subunit G
MRGDEVFRVTARKDEWGEVKDASDGRPGWICNECRFDKKEVSDWIIDGPSPISHQSVITANKYQKLVVPKETLPEVMGGRGPKLLMDIHSVSEVNKPEIQLSQIDGPATSDVFNKGKLNK